MHMLTPARTVPDDSPSPGDGGGEPAAIDAQVEIERVHILYERTPQALWGGLAFGGLLAWAFAPIVGAALAWGWWGARAVLLALRFADWRRFMHAGDAQRDAARWRRRHDLLATVDGVSWGLTGLVGHGDQPTLLDGVMLAGLLGVASVGVFTLTSHLRNALHFMGATLLPSFFFHLIQGGQLAWLVAGGLGIYFAVILFEARGSNGRTLELLRLRFENAAIAEQRQRALRLAEHSNAAKSRFLATVSHELRTPLNGILGMSELQALDGLSPEQASRNQVVQDSARHLLSVIGDLLDISRIEYGRVELHPQAVDLRTLLGEVAALLCPVAEAKGLRLNLRVDAGLPARAACDPVRVKQVLHNLVGNAVKFTDAGEVTLAATPRGDTIVFGVRDTGRGVTPEQAERIFEAFEQAPTSARVRDGTGLGLTISRHLARAMDGDVQYRATDGPGALFEFSMPCQPIDEPSALPPGNRPSPPRLPDAQVLVVEDNPVNALVATGMLDRLGLRWQLVHDGEQALARLAMHSFDLVLMDCQMPVLDGFEATRRWRAGEALRPGTQRLPIIALTAFAVEGDRARCEAAGMDGYLTKPFTLEALADAVGRHLAAAE